jgi:hypothetical protein
MKRFLTLCVCFLLAACNTAGPDITTTPTLEPAGPLPTITPTVTPSQTPLPPTEITLLPSGTPWVLDSGLSIEEHPLASRPEIEPLILLPLDGITQEQMLDAHAAEYQKSLRPESYYGVSRGSLWVMQGNSKLAAFFTGSAQGTVGVTRDGQALFSKDINLPPAASPIRVLAVYDDHWVLEIAKFEKIENGQDVKYFYVGEVFIDGKSVNEMYGYEESFAFQTINGRPFYFYKMDGKIGVSYDGVIIPIGYDDIPHYGCCSAGALNPRIAQNIIGFFAWRGLQWYYVEIGVFDSPNS